MARRFQVITAVLFLGAAVIPAKGNAHLTMTADEAVLATLALDPRYVVPVHYEGWAHLSQGRNEVISTFAAAGLGERLVWLAPGRPTTLLEGES